MEELWVCQLGTVDYREALELQERVRAARQADVVPDVMLVLEHWPVYTRGRRSGDGELPMGKDWYRAQGIDIIDVDRGGKITYHGPGQLVGYPIVRVDDVVAYVRTLERALVAALRQEGVADARARPQDGTAYTGVWVQDRKIASIGVHLARGVTTHGWAVNVENDLQPFSWVVACGLDGVQMTSLIKETARTAGQMRCFRKRAAFEVAQALGRRQRLISPARLVSAIAAVPTPAYAPLPPRRPGSVGQQVDHDRDDRVRIVPELAPGDPRESPPGPHQSLIPDAVMLERLARAMELVAVGLQHRLALAPHEVDPDRGIAVLEVERYLALGLRNAGSADQCEEVLLQPAGRRGVAGPVDVKRGAEPVSRRPRVVAPELVLQGPEVESALCLGLVDRQLQLRRRDHVGEVQQGASDVRAADTVDRGDVALGESGRAVDVDAFRVAMSAAGYVDAESSDRKEAVEQRRRSVREDRAGASGENRGDEVSLAGEEARGRDGVDAAVDAVQPPAGRPLLDRPGPEPERVELCQRENTMLRGRRGGKRGI
jgi:lipoyl(octanoyl) transferase